VRDERPTEAESGVLGNQSRRASESCEILFDKTDRKRSLEVMGVAETIILNCILKV
jgi:hypothetical protein